MATNATEEAADGSKVTEEDLKNDKLALEVEEAKAPDETAASESQEESEVSEEDGQTGDQADEPTFVKQVPSIAGDTEEEYLKNLETAYQQSTTEALRLKGLADKAKPESEDSEDSGPVDPRLLYLDRLLNKDIQTTFEEFKKDYPQVDDPVEYAKFTDEAKSLSEFYQTKKQILTADELYPKVASILGWTKQSTPDGKDKLGMALKDSAASSKVTSSSAKLTPKSKVTDEMIRVNKLMYPDKTEAQLREELEPYVK